MKRNLLFWFCRQLICVGSDTFFRGEVIGVDNVPRTGPILIASNHCSHLDPPLLGCQIPHQIRFFARPEIAVFDLLPKIAEEGKKGSN